MLLKYCKKEKSYYYAYVRLQQESNCRTAFAEDIYFLSEQEIEEAVLNDMVSNKPTTKKKKVIFSDLLIHKNKEQLLELLHSLLDNTTSKKDFSIATLALQELGLLGKYGTKRALYKALQLEFNNIGTENNFNYYLNPNNKQMILDSEVKSFKASIRCFVNKNS